MRAFFLAPSPPLPPHSTAYQKYLTFRSTVGGTYLGTPGSATNEGGWREKHTLLVSLLLNVSTSDVRITNTPHGIWKYQSVDTDSDSLYPGHEINETTPGVVQIEVAVTSHDELERIESKLTDDRRLAHVSEYQHVGLVTLLDGWSTLTPSPDDAHTPTPPLVRSGQCLPCEESTVITSEVRQADNRSEMGLNGMTGIIGFDCPTLQFDIDPSLALLWQSLPQHKRGISLHGQDGCTPRLLACETTLNDTEARAYYPPDKVYNDQNWIVRPNRHSHAHPSVELHQWLHYVRFGVDPTSFCTSNPQQWHVPGECDEVFFAGSLHGLFEYNCTGIAQGYACPLGFTSLRLVRDPACAPSPPSSPPSPPPGAK